MKVDMSHLNRYVNLYYIFSLLYLSLLKVQQLNLRIWKMEKATLTDVNMT